MNDVPARNLPAERKSQFTSGAPVAALVPQTLEEAYRLSQALAASGMVPRGIDKPEQILVAIMAGAELGLAPFQSLQSFAVVNGRPTLWGDGLMAVVRAKGVQVKEWIEGEDDQMVAHCLVTRPDTGEEIKRTFTVADAKKAGLWGKQGPWQQYPKRMLAMRARVAIRDGCADMLRGIQIREEVEDYTHVRDISPKASGLAARLSGPSGEGFTAARAEADAPVDFAEHAAEVAEAEIVAEVECAHEWKTDGNFHQCLRCGVIDDAGEVAPPNSVKDRLPEPADDFPGDRQDKAFDAPAWAADLNRDLNQFESVEKLNAFTDDPENIAKFEALQAASPGLAKSLGAAITGRRKALADREGGAQ